MISDRAIQLQCVLLNLRLNGCWGLAGIVEALLIQEINLGSRALGQMRKEEK